MVIMRVEKKNINVISSPRPAPCPPWRSTWTQPRARRSWWRPSRRRWRRRWSPSPTSVGTTCKSLPGNDVWFVCLSPCTQVYTHISHLLTHPIYSHSTFPKWREDQYHLMVCFLPFNPNMTFDLIPGVWVVKVHPLLAQCSALPNICVAPIFCQSY